MESCLDDYQFVMVMRDGSTNYFLVFYPEESIGLGASNLYGAFPLMSGSGYGALPGIYDAYKYGNESSSSSMNLASPLAGYGLLGGPYSGYANSFASPFNSFGMYSSPLYANSGLFSPLSLGIQLSSAYLNGIGGNLLKYIMPTNTYLANPATAISGYETILRETDSVRNAHANGFILPRLF